MRMDENNISGNLDLCPNPRGYGGAKMDVTLE